MSGVAVCPICPVYFGKRGVHSSEGLLSHSCLTELKVKAQQKSRGLGYHPVLGKYMKVTNALYNLPVWLGNAAGMTGFICKCGSKCCNSGTLSKISIFLVAVRGIVACWFSDAALQQGWLGGGFLAFSFTCSATVKCLLLMKILCCPVWFFYTVNWRAKWQQMWCSGFFLWFMLWFIWKAATYVREQSEYLCEQHSDSGLPWLTGLEGLISY